MPPASVFWLVALLLVGATVAALVWPLLRARAPRAVESEDVATTDVYRDQKRQLDAEWAAGAITRDERDASLDELATRLGAELDTPASQPTQPSIRSSYVAALILAAALPVTALALYAAFGNPGSIGLSATSDARAPKSHDEIDAMVEKLATRMKEQPEDPTGWRLLARAYAAMGRFQESVAAFNEAAARGPEDASLLADWADALGMQNQSLEGEPSRLIGRALALDPNHPKGLSLAASAAFYRKDYDAAIAAWQKLQAQYPAGSEQANEVGGMIAEADAAKRGVPVAAASATNGTPPRANALPSGSASAASASPPPTGPARTSAADANVAPPGASALSPGTAGTAADNASAITGNVSLDPKLRERTAPNDTLFIYARAASGPRMPLAILRTTARDLPRDFKLDDSMSMTPAARLSNATDVIVEARISKSGNATSTPGDLVGSSGSIKPGTRGLSLVINDVVR